MTFKGKCPVSMSYSSIVNNWVATGEMSKMRNMKDIMEYI